MLAILLYGWWNTKEGQVDASRGFLCGQQLDDLNVGSETFDELFNVNRSVLVGVDQVEELVDELVSGNLASILEGNDGGDLRLKLSAGELSISVGIEGGEGH